ncbi:carbon-monoxide dehydrogenase large subunit [Amycolatopsis mediterranei S699]|uniref:Carbon-monoxide dehydrogenase large subunit n=2 Tax=Amycolatopsis mediterranei TaxID=33910 RepID=A0A0H3D2L4_AMYMU|nr:xanthine dehydrogenase subunit D [Amycolatopsis mediterranei]ADJ43731.1 carbon-monoxide dehydrogenase large subunit [Amycolatopsis mediterranei U32]AEK40440.1 carbon-monoxide dehydrogenase large subunit [Amycolatopsis mediterranei S699]AFO75444.1 carbon-monoxide dehydrogenase large subunit [Amycolatopsis mediterranei S699]AGT82573.1 carbon-monoxide dehydrogenase large subunit [Amycolatopsis mediterranei RB]KDO10176.1 carbon monoxide dehydrogenase [Amycolatopsis mediterranei]
MTSTTSVTTTTANGVGTSPRRPDGTVKVRGEFAYSSDLWHEDMVWGVTLRSPHPYARIASIDIAEALAVPGVYAVLTHEDVPGVNRYGLEHADQPVLASAVVRYQGEPVALVAADHPETARRAMKRIVVSYEELEPVTDSEAAVAGEGPSLHEGGNVVRHVKIRRGPQDRTADVVVSGVYEVGMQDQAFLGPESGLAVPDTEGGVDLYVATQWLHVDQQQIVAALGLPIEKVRLTLGGVGGAFGGREDLSMQVHACLLALHTGKPVKMVYNREESFYGHVHRHPAKMYYEHGATRDGRLVYVRTRLYLDGGAYASSTGAVVANAATLGVGPYKVDSAAVDCWGTYTNNPPCGAMRGFGAVQAAFGYESQMDKLAAACGLDPVEIRVRNAMSEGDLMPTGQVVDAEAPVAELLSRVREMPMPPERPFDLRHMPGGVSNTTHGEGVVRGVGYAVGIKNVCFSEGFDDYSTARVRLQLVGGEPAATVHTAACEVGQGLVTIMQQIVRTELGVDQVTVLPMDTSIGNGGSTSASRQTYVTGGAVQAACVAVRARLLSRFDQRVRVVGGKLVAADGQVLADLVDVLADDVYDETVEWRHRPTSSLDPETGQGTAHVQYAFAAHRAVVDVDTELGLVKVVALDCAQDVGKALNPQAVLGQIQGGSAQGLGLAVMEEIQTSGGKIRNPSFTDYLIPTVLDMPPMIIDVLERPDPHAPYGLRGVGEPPTISSTPAIVAAIRAATGLALTRVPVRPEHLTGT